MGCCKLNRQAVLDYTPGGSTNGILSGIGFLSASEFAGFASVGRAGNRPWDSRSWAANCCAAIHGNKEFFLFGLKAGWFRSVFSC